MVGLSVADLGLYPAKGEVTWGINRFGESAVFDILVTEEEAKDTCFWGFKAF